jgi:hypothetical protein
MSRLRRESRDARKIRYSASRIGASTKNITNNAFSIIFFASDAKNPSKRIFLTTFFASPNDSTVQRRRLTDGDIADKHLRGTRARHHRAFFQWNEF